MCGVVITRKGILFRAGLMGVLIAEWITWRDDGQLELTPEDSTAAVCQVHALFAHASFWFALVLSSDIVLTL